MKNKQIVLSTLLLTLMLLCCPAAKAVERIQRLLATHEFDVIEFAELNLDVKYGDIIIVNHPQNTIKINVTATLVTNRPADAERIFEQLDLQISGDEFKVSVTADPGKTNPGKGNNLTVSVHVSMPEAINLTMNHMFGSAAINSVAGKSVVGSRYAKFNARLLSHEDNDLNFDFGNGQIDYISGGKVSASYGEINILNASNLQLNSDYANARINRVDNLRLQAEGGSVEVGTAGDIWLTSKFTEITVKELLNRLVADIEFGRFKFEQIAGGFSWVEIRSNFANGQLEFDVDDSFHIQAEMISATLKYPAESANFTEKISSPSKSSFTGGIGDVAEPSGDVIIKSSNGVVTISQK